MSGYSIIDVDTHVTELPDLWTSRVPAEIRNLVPNIQSDDDGNLMYYVGEESMGYGPGAVSTAGVGNLRTPPTRYEDMHPGAYDAKARLEYMDGLGIWAMVMYPNLGGFGGQTFPKLMDPELMLTCVRTYNDWQTEWASVDARRLLPITTLPFWDVGAAAEEIRRCAAMGHRGILFTGDPVSLGQPSIGDPHWNPLWEAAVEHDLPVSFHLGSGNMEEQAQEEEAKTAAYGQMASFAAATVDLFLKNAMHLNELLISGVLVRYPEIKFISVESGIGWIPFVLEALDYQFLDNEVRKDRPDLELLPSEYFARNVYACYWFEQVAPKRLIDKVGADRVLFETDFPHPTSLFGDEVHRRIEGGLGDCEDSVRRKILWENAQKLYKVESPTAEDEARLAATKAATP
jgi:predicted TIM-barrel fold metal-dependent hydrolase